MKMANKNYQYYTEQDIQECLVKIKAGMGKKTASRLHRIPVSTIRYRLSDNYKNGGHRGAATVLTKEEEFEIVEWIKQSKDEGLPLSIATVIANVQSRLQVIPRKNTFKNNKPGRGWVKLFLKRHPDITLLRSTDYVTSENARMHFKTSVLYKTVKDEVKLRPNAIPTKKQSKMWGHALTSIKYLNSKEVPKKKVRKRRKEVSTSTELQETSGDDTDVEIINGSDVEDINEPDLEIINDEKNYSEDLQVLDISYPHIKCIAKDCGRFYIPKQHDSIENNVTFFTFPTQLKMFAAWERFCNHNRKKNPVHIDEDSKLCSLHFRQDCLFVVRKGMKLVLDSGAEPTVVNSKKLGYNLKKILKRQRNLKYDGEEMVGEEKEYREIPFPPPLDGDYEIGSEFKKAYKTDIEDDEIQEYENKYEYENEYKYEIEEIEEEEVKVELTEMEEEEVKVELTEMEEDEVIPVSVISKTNGPCVEIFTEMQDDEEEPEEILS